MNEKIKEIDSQLTQKIEGSQTLADIEKLKIEILGPKSALSQLTKEISSIAQDQRAEFGKQVNQLKKDVFEKLEEVSKRLTTQKENFTFDPTIPPQLPSIGHLHLVTQAIEEIVEIFHHLGFRRVRYPEVDWDYYAFESLNMPLDHPARDEWETFFIDKNTVLTPHTSNGQVREMENSKPPIRMLNIARCYRRQADLTHTPMFHQFEGLLIDKDVSITNLIGTLDFFAKNFFGPKRRTRLRPFHFQFTEPSFEVDISCGVCLGTGKVKGTICKICKSGWLELGGAGMVHPKVLKFGGVDARIYNGFAFGWGVERVYLMKEGIKIPDLRMFYQNDIRFLEQF